MLFYCDRILYMKTTRCILPLALAVVVVASLVATRPALAKVISAPRLLAWETVGTEVSTNISLVTHRDDVRGFVAAMDFAGTASNCVQMAFGRDADGDGELELAETDLLVGWRAGRYFIEDSAAGTRHEEPAAPSEASLRTFALHVGTGPMQAVQCAYASDDTGTRYFDGVLASRPSWLFISEWNLCKVTRRGVDEPQEWCRAEKSFGHFFLRIR